MKKNKALKNQLLVRTVRQFIGKILLFTVSIPIVAFVAIEVIKRLDFQWIYDKSPNLYRTARSIFFDILLDFNFLFVLLLIFWLMGCIVLFYQLLKKTFSYVKEITAAANNLVDKEVEYIKLSPELIEIENQFNDLKKESEKNERLAKENEQKKDELVVYLAHDIKTPLTVMIGYLSLLEEMDDMPKEKQKKYINTALEKSYRLEELINELFDIARFNSEKIILEKEELNLNVMLEQIIDDFYPIMKECHKKIKLQTMENIKIIADPDKLSRVFSNLIKNAIYYSREKSDIRINVTKKEENVIIDIINKGKQIPQEKLDRIFERFYRLDAARSSTSGGSGLGLAIAKDIVELHNGKILAESNKLETTFHVELPLK